MTEDFVIKYFWSAIGYGLMSIPIFYPTIGKAMPGHGLGEHDQVAARAEGRLYTVHGEKPANIQGMSPTGDYYSLLQTQEGD
jgi:hypothetical protein